MTLLALLLAACTADADKADTADTDTTDTDTDTNTDGLALEDIVGAWTTGCYASGGGYYSVNLLDITSGEVSYHYTQYPGDATCTDTPVTSAETLDRSWTLGAELAVGYALDEVRESAVYTLYTQDVVDAWNAGSGCGPFAVGVPVDVSGTTCWGFWQPEAGGTIYNVAALSADGVTLALGDPASGDMRTEATRPTTLQTVTYQRR
jgi:hypothetical protein